MRRVAGLTSYVFLFLLRSAKLYASDTNITITEFRHMYDTLLAGKTFVTIRRRTDCR
jgi:hypothetical protein